MEYKINQPVWAIEINKANEAKSYRPNGIVVEKHKIIGISKYKICIDNDWFTTFSFAEEGERKNRSIYSYLDDVSVRIRTKNNILGDGIFISLYSTKKPTKRTFKKMIAAACVKIDEDYGFLFESAKDELWDMLETNLNIEE